MSGALGPHSFPRARRKVRAFEDLLIWIPFPCFLLDGDAGRWHYQLLLLCRDNHQFAEVWWLGAEVGQSVACMETIETL